MKEQYRNAMITLNMHSPTRDPFVLLHGGKYYIYATGWTVSYSLTDRLDGEYSEPRKCVENPDDLKEHIWAPEVYVYDDRFYMFTTYRSAKNNHRGCAVFVSDTPEGPFKLHSDGHITPYDWDAIDGTLYVDECGQPWMVFVHEWTSTDDGIGRMAVAKLSDDLKCLVSEPIELFRADSPKWSQRCVTDGCFLYRTDKGKLLMIWSNWDSFGYCVGIAESDNGKVDGNWIQHEEVLYSQSYTGEYDGGHGMIFKDNNGALWLSMHSPNHRVENRFELPILLPLKEENDMLSVDFSRRLNL